MGRIFSPFFLPNPFSSGRLPRRMVSCQWDSSPGNVIRQKGLWCKDYLKYSGRGNWLSVIRIAIGQEDSHILHLPSMMLLQLLSDRTFDMHMSDCVQGLFVRHLGPFLRLTSCTTQCYFVFSFAFSYKHIGLCLCPCFTEGSSKSSRKIYIMKTLCIGLKFV